MNDEVQGEMPSEDTPAGTPTLAQLTKAYITMRDAKDALTDKYKQDVADIEAQMATVEEAMLETCKQFNADSIRTPYGTIVRSVKSRYWTNDWDSMHRFISEHHAFGLLEKRLHQTHMKEFLSENPDLLPVGLNVENAYTVVVRRSKGS
jgi:hypothetical protein